MGGPRFRIPGKKPAPAAAVQVIAKPVIAKAVAATATGAKQGALSVAAPIVKAQTLAAAADAKIEQIRARASADVERIRELSRTIARAFHEIGQALARLKDPLAYAALGYKSFAELCAKEFSFSVDKADELALIATQMTREEAMGVGQKKAIAVVRLCRATIE